jgi:hypothetical protein
MATLVLMDKIFSQIEEWQRGAWGRVLDAGTGRHSLGWISGLPTSGWTAVTGGIYRAKALESEFQGKMRSQDRVICGNWIDRTLLLGERFDVVVADYLLGAIDGHSPYFQDQLFTRLRPLVDDTMYVVGLEPFPGAPASPAGRLVNEIARLRDACILLAGHRCFREYPREWAERHLIGSGFEIEGVATFPISFGRKYIDGQLDVCLAKLRFFRSSALAEQMRTEIGSLRERGLDYISENGGLSFGEDYVIACRPVG